MGQFAAIIAAEQEGFALDEVLAVEGINGRRWLPERARLLSAVAQDADLHAAYSAHLAAAQDRLHCPIVPLYDDVRAWVALLRLCDQAPLSQLLSQHGLRPNDFARLERHWKKRLADDPQLAGEAARLRQACPPPELPALTVGERRLTPSSFAQAAATEPGGQAQPGGTHPPELTQTAADRLMPMASLYAALLEGAKLADICRRCGFAHVAAAKTAMAAWDGRLKADPSLAADFRALVAHHRHRQQQAQAAGAAAPPAPAQPARPAAPPAAAEPPLDVDVTAFVLAVLADEPALPFQGVAAPPPAAMAAAAASEEAGQTGPIRQSLVAAAGALPFDCGAPAATADLDATTTVVALDATTAVVALDATTAMPAVRDDRTTPFDAGSAPPAPPPLVAEGLAPAAAGLTAPIDLARLQGGRLPFDTTPVGADPAAQGASQPPAPPRRAVSALALAAPGRFRPSSAKSPAAGRLEPEADAAPAILHRPVAGPGTLTLAQLAAVETEIAIHPERLEQVLYDYGLTSQSRTELAQVLSARFGEPKVRHAYMQATQDYRAWRLAHQQ